MNYEWAKLSRLYELGAVCRLVGLKDDRKKLTRSTTKSFLYERTFWSSILKSYESYESYESWFRQRGKVIWLSDLGAVSRLVLLRIYGN